MKNYYNITFLLLFLNSLLIAQTDFVLDIRNYEKGIILWNDQQVSEITKKFGIQDTFFNSNLQLKNKFKILKYLSEEDINNYCLSTKKNGQISYDFENYIKDMRSGQIDKIDEWVILLTMYPNVAKVYYEDQGANTTSGFNEFLRKLKKRELLMFIKDNGSTVIVENTRKNYNMYKHLTRLK